MKKHVYFATACFTAVLASSFAIHATIKGDYSELAVKSIEALVVISAVCFGLYQAECIKDDHTKLTATNTQVTDDFEANNGYEV